GADRGRGDAGGDDARGRSQWSHVAPRRRAAGHGRGDPCGPTRAAPRAGDGFGRGRTADRRTRRRPSRRRRCRAADRGRAAACRAGRQPVLRTGPVPARLSATALFQPTVLLALALMAIIAMMVLPMPAWVLDLGLAASFSLAILIFTTTLFINRPLDFSAFPTILLASRMLRPSLNVSSTKLIIGQGHAGRQAAGHVIEGFAMFIMGGSILIGLVIFGVLLIVNSIVLTKGAGRMAEVGARF